MKLKSIVCIIVCCMLGTCLSGCQKSEDLIETWYMQAEFDRNDLDESDIIAAIETLIFDEKYTYTISEEGFLESEKAYIIRDHTTEISKLPTEILFYSTVEDAHDEYMQGYHGRVIGCITPDYSSVGNVRINTVVFEGCGLVIRDILIKLGFSVSQTKIVECKSQKKRISNELKLNSILEYVEERKFLLQIYHDNLFYIINQQNDRPYIVYRYIDNEGKLTDENNYRSSYFDDNMVDQGQCVYYTEEYIVLCIGDDWLALLDEVGAWLGKTEK